MEEFKNTVKEMRKAQKNYFSTRSNTWLQIAKELERKVDQMIKADEEASLPKQTTLF